MLFSDRGNSASVSLTSLLVVISTQPLCAIGVRASIAVLAMSAVPVLAYAISFPELDGLNHSFFAEHLRCAADAACTSTITEIRYYLHLSRFLAWNLPC